MDREFVFGAALLLQHERVLWFSALHAHPRSHQVTNGLVRRHVVVAFKTLR